MNYEKKYEKLVDAVKVLRDNNPSDEGIQNWVNDNVPELKESEDEKIIRWIIDDIRYNMNNEPLNNSEYKKKAEKAITWLENQGEKGKPQWKPSEEQLNALDEIYKTHGANSVCRRIIFNLLEQLKKL